MAKDLRSISNKGVTLAVPHAGNLGVTVAKAVTFDSDGDATDVADTLAAAILAAYPKYVEDVTVEEE